LDSKKTASDDITSVNLTLRLKPGKLAHREKIHKHFFG